MVSVLSHVIFFPEFRCRWIYLQLALYLRAVNRLRGVPLIRGVVLMLRYCTEQKGSNVPLFLTVFRSEPWSNDRFLGPNLGG